VSAIRRSAWALLLAYLLVIVGFTGEPSPVAQALAASGIVFTIGLAIAIYSWKGAILLLAACLTIPFAVENLGVHTGFPYGRYHFEVGASLPHVGVVPVIVGPLYFCVGFLAWIVASVLLDDADLKLDRRLNVVVLPILSAFVMVQWDLVMDPPNSTLERAWLWHDGGGYFGVPLSNYLGWYLTVWLFFQAFAVIIRRRPELFSKPRSRLNAEIRLVPILFYLAIALSQIAPYLGVSDRLITDPAGRTWHAQDIRESSVLVALFSMVPTAILALFRQLHRLISTAG